MQKCTACVGEPRTENRAKKIKTTQALMQRLASEQAYIHALRSGHPGGCLLAPLPPFSSLFPSFFSFSLSPSSPLSVLLSKADLGKRAPRKQPRGWYCTYWGNATIRLHGVTEHGDGNINKLQLYHGQRGKGYMTFHI